MIEDLLEIRRARQHELAARKKRRNGDGQSGAEVAHLAGVLSAAASALGREDVGVGQIWASERSVFATLAKGGAREVCEIPFHALGERWLVLASLTEGIVKLNRRLAASAARMGGGANTRRGLSWRKRSRREEAVAD